MLPRLWNVSVQSRMVHGIAHGLRIGLARQHDLECFGRERMDLFQELISFHSRHDVIRDNQRDVVVILHEFINDFECILAVLGCFNHELVTQRLLELGLQAVKDHFFVVYAQDNRFLHDCSSPALIVSANSSSFHGLRRHRKRFASARARSIASSLAWPVSMTFTMPGSFL